MGPVQMDNLKGFQGIRRMDKVLNAQRSQLCGVMKGVDEKIDEGVLRWFYHVESKDCLEGLCWRVCW